MGISGDGVDDDLDPETKQAFRAMHIINRIVYWKFKQVDRKPRDKFLSKHELKRTRERLKSISPNCADLLLENCDVNSDNKFSRREWRQCFGYKKIGGIRRKENQLSTPSTG